MSLPLAIAALVGVSLLGAPKSAVPSKPAPAKAAPQQTKAKPQKTKLTQVKLKVRRHRAQRTAHSKPVPLKHAPGSRAEAYAAMSESTCLSELDRRHVPYSREEPKRGVKIPVRLTGRVGGVLYRTDFPDNQRDTVPWEVYDCRLVLAMDDLSEILRAHAVAEARIFSAWRPPSSKSCAMDDWQRRHPGGLAVDVRELRKDTGETLNVLDHFNGRLGATLCKAPPSPDTPEARELHDIACAAADAHIFNSILTPNYNPAHKNHFHLEVTPDVDWFMVR